MINQISKISLVVLCAILSIQIALILPALNWETDYGHLYYISSFNEGKKLYYDFFNHKGPLSVFLLDSLSLFIGYGWKQSILSYFVVIFTLFLSSFYFSYNFSKNYFLSLITILFLLTFFRSQGSNIYLDLIVNIFILISISYLLKFLENSKLLNFYISISLLILATLARIDAALYSFLHIFFFLLYSKNKNIKFYLKVIFVNFLIFLLIILFFKITYEFTIEEYFVSNVIFNLDYSKNFQSFSNLSSLYHFLPNKLITFVLLIKVHLYYFFYKSKRNNLGLFLIFITLLQSLIFFTKYNNAIIFLTFFATEMVILIYLNYRFNYFSKKIIISFFIFFYTFFLFLLAGTNKFNHALMLLPGTMCFYICIINYISNLEKYFKIILFSIIFLLSLDQFYKFERNNYLDLSRNELIKFENGIENFFYDNSKIKNNELLKKLDGNIPILCDRGWIHVFNNLESKTFMFDWWKYEQNSSYNTAIGLAFNKLISDLKNGKYKYFFIDEACITNSISNNELIISLLKNTYEEGTYEFFGYNYSLRKFYE